MPRVPVIFRAAAPAVSRRLSTLPSETIGELLLQKIKWDAPLASKISEDIIAEKGKYSIKLGDFPEEPMFTLLKNGQKIRELDSLPDTWSLPKAGNDSEPTPKP